MKGHQVKPLGLVMATAIWEAMGEWIHRCFSQHSSELIVCDPSYAWPEYPPEPVGAAGIFNKLVSEMKKYLWDGITLSKIIEQNCFKVVSINTGVQIFYMYCSEWEMS